MMHELRQKGASPQSKIKRAKEGRQEDGDGIGYVGAFKREEIDASEVVFCQA